MTVEQVLMNKETGNLGVGIRVCFYDKQHQEKLGNMEGYSISLREDTYEGWLFEDITSTGIPVWIYANKEHVENKCEVLGPLT